MIVATKRHIRGIGTTLLLGDGTMPTMTAVVGEEERLHRVVYRRRARCRFRTSRGARAIRTITLSPTPAATITLLGTRCEEAGRRRSIGRIFGAVPRR